MKKTYKVNHPKIKKIKIGDKFELNDGTIVTFVSYASYNVIYCYLMSNNRLYDYRLKCSGDNIDSESFFKSLEMEKNSVKDVFPSLKFKLSLI